MISWPPLGGGWQREALTGGEKTAYYVSPSVKTFGFDTSLTEGGKDGGYDNPSVALRVTPPFAQGRQGNADRHASVITGSQ